MNYMLKNTEKKLQNKITEKIFYKEQRNSDFKNKKYDIDYNNFLIEKNIKQNNYEKYEENLHIKKYSLNIEIDSKSNKDENFLVNKCEKNENIDKNKDTKQTTFIKLKKE